MSGHSKWSQIKHKKAATDKKKGATFSKLAAAISIAAKQGGGDPTSNFKLRLAIEKARAVNMPNENVERAIKRGTGGDGTSIIEEVTYEGFGPSGVAIIVEGATDNKNRTTSEIKNIFSEFGGRLAGPGAVSYQFESKGIIVIKTQENLEEFELELIDMGAEDIEEVENTIMIYTAPEAFGKVRKILEEKGVEIVSSELVKESKNQVQITDKETAEKALKLVEALEENEDVLAVYSNFDIPQEILKQLS